MKTWFPSSFSSTAIVDWGTSGCGMGVEGGMLSFELEALRLTRVFATADVRGFFSRTDDFLRGSSMFRHAAMDSGVEFDDLVSLDPDSFEPLSSTTLLVD